MGSRGRGSSLSTAVLATILSLQVAARVLPEGALAEDNKSCTPRQLHVALTGDPTELRISWKTKGNSCPTEVDYRLSSSADNGIVSPLLKGKGSSTSYDNNDFCASPARDYNYDTPQYLHHVTLRGLEPGRKYTYTVAGGGEEVPFRAPAATSPKSSFTFLAYGDMGESDHHAAKSPGAADTQAAVMREVEHGAELILHVGDISYANGRPEVWNTFMEYIEPFASQVPYMVAIGNHEYDYARHISKKDPSGTDEPFDPDWGNFGNDSGGECGVATTKTFAMPDVADLGYWPLPNCTSATSPSSGSIGAGPSAAASCQNVGLGQHNPTLGPDGAAASRGEHYPAAAGSSNPAHDPQAAAAAGGDGGGDDGKANHHSKKPNPPFWYSFSYGSVHFTFISTEHDVSPGSAQYKWLEHDLRRVDRCRTPWLVVAMHRPMYVVFPHKSNRVVGDHLRGQLEGLFDDYEVDLVITGHVHSYSRTCNVLDERCRDQEEGGMTHVTVGCAGRKLSSVEFDQPDWLEFAQSEFGFGRVTVRDGHSLTWDFIRSDDGRVHDSATIYNKRDGRRGCDDNAFDAVTSQGVLSSRSVGDLAGMPEEMVLAA